MSEISKKERDKIVRRRYYLKNTEKIKSRTKKYIEDTKHPCRDCDKMVLRESILCSSCSKIQFFDIKGRKETIKNPYLAPGGVSVHRKVMSKMIGRNLRRGEIVHHKNRDTRNNKEKNLLLLRSVSAHRRIHAFVNRHGLDISIINFNQSWLYADTNSGAV